MPSAELRRFARIIRERRPFALQPLAERRRQMEEAQARLALPADVREQSIEVAGRPARWFDAPQSRDTHVLLYLHGGGYVQGSIDTHRELMARLARACRCRVLGLDYRLAPEFPFPAGLDDVLSAWRWLLDQGFAPERMMIGGDSAGGGLTLAALISLRDSHQPLPAAAVLLSPWTDVTASGESFTSRAEVDPMLDMPFLHECSRDYCGGQAPDHPLISPCFADLRALPPLLLQVGDAEVLLDDSTRVAAAVRAAGGSVELQVWPEAFHVFHSFPQLPESTEAVANIGRFFDLHMDDRHSGSW